jgi:serine phosphatase RsbU (regulator of sigma subunit)
MVADATGHGIDSTLLVAECRAIIRALFSKLSSPARVMERANRLMCGPLGREERFVTLFLGALDDTRHSLRYVNAGQSPALHRSRDGHLVELPSCGLPLGVLPDSRFVNRSLRLGPGDTLFLGTDGLVEWRDEAGEMFGEKRLRQTLEVAGPLSAHRLIDEVFARVESFAGSSRNLDDVTLLALKRAPDLL